MKAIREHRAQTVGQRDVVPVSTSHLTCNFGQPLNHHPELQLHHLYCLQFIQLLLSSLTCKALLGRWHNSTIYKSLQSTVIQRTIRRWRWRWRWWWFDDDKEKQNLAEDFLGSCCHWPHEPWSWLKLRWWKSEWEGRGKFQRYCKGRIYQS